jgi:hypothetical protein
MKIEDIRKYEWMLREHHTLKRFIQIECKASYIGIYIPTEWEIEKGSRDMLLPQSIHLDDKTAIDAIMSLALPAARKRVADIEAELTKAGVEYER